MADASEYRERTITIDIDGSVEFYLSWKRDFDSLMNRLEKQGIKPLKLEHLEPGYRVVVAAEHVRHWTQLARKPREMSEEQREVARQRFAVVRAAS